MTDGGGKRKGNKRFFWATKAGCRGCPTVASWCDPWGIGQSEAHARGGKGPFREHYGAVRSQARERGVGKVAAPA